jgi:two-component system sensor histidine kinase QseC
MTPSIRTFLLINLLLSVTLITSLAIIGSLFLEHKDLQSHLDAKLTETAFTMQALINRPLTTHDKGIIQKRINSIPNLQDIFYTKNGTPLSDSDEKVQFQVWDKNGKLLLRSRNAPDKPFVTNKFGLLDDWLYNEPWRMFVTRDPVTGVKVIAAEEYNFRNVLEGRITQDSIIIMMLTYPILALLIWIIVGRGLQSLQRVASEVRHRVPNYLESVNLEHVPHEIKPLVDELNKLFSRLKEAFDREKRFAADAAHELRTPLAALKAHTQVALNSTTEDERIEALNKVLASVDRSTHVVQQLLILSRMVPEASLDYTTPINLTRQAQEIIADLAPEALKKNTDIELISPDAPVMIAGNATGISILLRNLVDNAIRYTPENSNIQVLLDPTANNTVTLTVIDNGPGIPVHLRTRVFERFFRIIGNKSSGSGLGLGIVQQIAELHKASIELSTGDNGVGLKIMIIFSAL